MKNKMYASVGKRIFDLIGSMGLLITLSPVMAVIALAIKVDSNGPVFYEQTRIGRNGRPYKLIKFRSMVVGAEKKGAGILVQNKDPRITLVGRWIRRLSLDEIPQLFNVLAGQMSLVGPRPGLDYQVAQYNEQQRRRLLVRPGVTGWAQVMGRNKIDWGRRIELDLEYIEQLSLATDLLVLIKTIPAVLKGQDMIANADYWKEKAHQQRIESRSGGEKELSAPTVKEKSGSPTNPRAAGDSSAS